MTNLERRIKRFDSLVSCNRFFLRPSPLVLILPIPDKLFFALKTAVALYMSRCLDQSDLYLDGEEALKKFDLITPQGIPNCTPNGGLVCKSHLVFEFNMLIRAYMDIIQNSCIQEVIDFFAALLFVRYKNAQFSGNNLTRNFPTECAHSDAWIDEVPYGINIILPLFGDTEYNHVKCFAPPNSFEESWLNQLPNFHEGKKVFERYQQTPTEATIKKGYLYIFDFSVIHQTVIEPGAGSRISIDLTGFFNRDLLSESDINAPKSSHPRLSYHELRRIGHDRMMVFPEKTEKDHHQAWKIINLNQKDH